MGLIYGLASTSDAQHFRYVGYSKTKISYSVRLEGHLKDAKNDSVWNVHQWIRKELEQGFEIKQTLLQERVAKYYEAIWAYVLFAKGHKLLNRTFSAIANNLPEVNRWAKR